MSLDRLTTQDPGWTRVTVDFSESIGQLSFRIFRAWATRRQEILKRHDSSRCAIIMIYSYLFIVHTTVCIYVLCFNGQRLRRRFGRGNAKLFKSSQVFGGRTCHIYSACVSLYHPFPKLLADLVRPHHCCPVFVELSELRFVQRVFNTFVLPIIIAENCSRHSIMSIKHH